MHKIKEKLMETIDEYEKKLKKSNGGELSAGDIEYLHKITDTIKNIDKIEMLEEENGYSSRGGEWEAQGSYRGGYSRDNGSPSYDDGMSNARRGEHYVRGHYSRNDGYSMDDDYSMARRYSRDGGKDYLVQKIGAMMPEANAKEREVLERAIKQIENA